MKTLYIIIIVVLGLALIIFTIVRNNKDKKDFEKQSENDFKKQPVDD
jgi:uncharacterized alpha/beta hydrolase family protein